jgi:hypothetical protein
VGTPAIRLGSKSLLASGYLRKGTGRGDLGRWKEIEMEDYRISKHWLTTKIEPEDPKWSWAVDQLRPEFDTGDELWHFNKLAPPGINAGAMGIALVSNGEPIRTIMTGIH